MKVCDRCGTKDSPEIDVLPTDVVTYQDNVQQLLDSIGDLCDACRDSLIDVLDRWQNRQPLQLRKEK